MSAMLLAAYVRWVWTWIPSRPRRKSVRLCRDHTRAMTGCAQFSPQIKPTAQLHCRLHARGPVMLLLLRDMQVSRLRFLCCSCHARFLLWRVCEWCASNTWCVRCWRGGETLLSSEQYWRSRPSLCLCLKTRERVDSRLLLIYHKNFENGLCHMRARI